MRWGYISSEFIEECTTNFPAFAEVIKHYPPQIVAERCGISVNDLEKAVVIGVNLIGFYLCGRWA